MREMFGNSLTVHVHEGNKTQHKTTGHRVQGFTSKILSNFISHSKGKKVFSYMVFKDLVCCVSTMCK